MHYLFLLFIGFHFAFLSSCDKGSDAFADVDQQFDQLFEESGAASVAACIIKGDSIVWDRYAGFASIEEKDVPTIQTGYILASISKLITATAVLQLAEKNLLDLDREIGQYLPYEIQHPAFPEQAITSRMLLTHRSGLAWPRAEDFPEFYENFTGDTAQPLYPWLEEFLIPGHAEYDPRAWYDYSPGSTQSYSNIGFALLGLVVEAVSGIDFNEYCRSNIFEPLQMHNTSFRLNDLNSTKLAMPYHDGKKPYGHYSVKFYPATTLRSSVEEFSHFLIAYLNGGVYKGQRILEELTVKDMLRSQLGSSNLGLAWWNISGGWTGHSGGYYGCSTETEIHFIGKVAFLIFSNSYDKVNKGSSLYSLVKEEAKSYL